LRVVGFPRKSGVTRRRLSRTESLRKFNSEVLDGTPREQRRYVSGARDGLDFLRRAASPRSIAPVETIRRAERTARAANVVSTVAA
jgi:hypothetical protein